MDNQHKQIKGYRDLSEQEIALMNEAEELANKVGKFCEKLQSLSPPCGQTGITLTAVGWLSAQPICKRLYGRYPLDSLPASF
jgi:hypothetical protein